MPMSRPIRRRWLIGKPLPPIQRSTPQWQQFYANALLDGLWKTNIRRKETLSQMTRDDWRTASRVKCTLICGT
jgi:hypothetical protein